MSSRRKFIRQLGGTAGLLTASSLSALGEEKWQILRADKKISSADNIKIAGIGMGIIGHYDMDTALKVPGVELLLYVIYMMDDYSVVKKNMATIFIPQGITGKY